MMSLLGPCHYPQSLGRRITCNDRATVKANASANENTKLNEEEVLSQMRYVSY